MSVGGRIGHSSLHALNIHEGSRKDPGGRRWEVEILSAGDVRESEYRQRDEAKAAERETKQATKLDDSKRRILRAATKYPEGETATTLRDQAGLKQDEFRAALAALLESGDIVATDVVKPNRKTPYGGYKLVTNE
jgi:hypothetical protein